MSLPKPPHLSDSYWESLSDSDREMYAIIRPAYKAAYCVDIHLSGLENFLDGTQRDMERVGGSFELNPDFQRGHVWTLAQQIAYVEALLRGRAPNEIQFNCSNWLGGDAVGDIAKDHFQCVDGLQRLTAVRAFLRNEFKVFGRYLASDLRATAFDPHRIRLSIHIHEMAWKKDLLQYYLDINSGGSVHTEAELNRVRLLLDQATQVGA